MKFLIIDDNDIDCSLTLKTLRSKFADVDIAAITNREAFDEIIAQAGFDLVITEYQLGWTDGLTLFKDIHARFACIPVIMLTDSGNEVIAVTAIKSGMADYIVKRNRHALPDAVEQCLPKAQARNHCKDADDNILLCKKWDLAISRLTSDFAYSMRILSDGRPIIEWVTGPFKRFISNNSNPSRESGEQAYGFGLPIHPDDLAIVQRRFEKLLAGHEDTTEYRVMTNKGKVRCFSDHALPIRDLSTGKVVRIYGAIQDITRRRNAEEKLHLIQRAIDSSNNGINITGLEDTDWAIIYANEAFQRMTGYSSDELLGHNCRFLQRDDRNQPGLENLRDALDKYCDGYAILRNYRKDGSLFWNEVYISPIRDKQGKVTHYVGMQNDVTHRIEMEELLSKSETKLRTILENVLDGIIIIDENGIIESINPSAEKIFGYPAEELIGDNINRLMPEPDHSRHGSYLTNYLSSGNSKIIGIGREVKGLRKDGSIFPMDLGISGITIDQRHLFIGTIHDISERKRSEETLRELSSHLQSVREEESTRIAREIHDELGSILAALKMDLNWLNKRLPKRLSDCHEKVGAMNRHIDGAIQAVRQIATDLRPSILDHLGLLAAIDWQVEQFRQQTGMHCIVAMPDHDIVLDENRMTAVFRIVQEALTNIALHSGATQVTLDIEEDMNHLVIKIADNGCGMTFAQMHKPHAYGIQGMNERARHFGGEVTFISNPGAGTALVLRIPLQSYESRDRHD